MCKENVNDMLKLALVVVIIGFLLLPVQFFIFGIAWISMGFVYEIIHREVFGRHFPWGLIVDIRRVVEFLFTSFGIYIIYTLIYSIVSFFVKKKIEYFLLAILVFNVLFSIIALDMRRPVVVGFPVFSDVPYHMAYAFLFAMIMFASFTLIMRFLDRKAEWRKWKIILSSFIISIFSGSILSSVVWVILFLIFHGPRIENWINL